METRALGEILTISIGTAIPLETLLKSQALIKGYDFIFLNLRTLHRNYHASFSTTPVIRNNTDYLNGFLTELEIIEGIINSTISTGTLRAVFYIATAKSLPAIMPRAKIKQLTTTKQFEYDDLEKDTIRKVQKKLGEKINVYDVLINGQNTAALIITHCPIDLLSAKRFRKLSLLESHTGAIKSKNEWILKLTKDENHRNIPFNALTLQIFGDNIQLSTLGSAYKKHIVELSKKNQWTALTTMVKMLFDIRKLSDKYLVAILTQLSQVTLK